MHENAQVIKVNRIRVFTNYVHPSRYRKVLRNFPFGSGSQGADRRARKPAEKKLGPAIEFQQSELERCFLFLLFFPISETPISFPRVIA